MLTKIGEAHLENFKNQDELIQEKLKRFSHVDKSVFILKTKKVHQAILENAHLAKTDKYTYGYSNSATVQIKQIQSNQTRYANFYFT